MMKFLIILLCMPIATFASGELRLDKAPDRSNDMAALQNGAKVFINYCLNCHSASFMRYNRMKDIGLTEDLIKKNFPLMADKVGEPMRNTMHRDEGKIWFGVAPPDLTIIERARASEFGSGSDWLYTFMRTFYRDENRPISWNNKILENAGMPHVLWELQGIQEMGEDHNLKLVVPGTMKPDEYDSMIADLVAYLKYMGEPVAEFRKQLGVIVVIFLSIALVFAYALKREYWKDIH